MSDPRACASLTLVKVRQEQRSMTAALAENAGHLPDSRDRALHQELVFGVLRWLPRLQALVGILLDKPLRSKDKDIENLLFIGLYQLGYLDIPVHAAVNTTVAACRSLRKDWAARLVNAALRRYLREREPLEARIMQREEVYYAHPLWLIDVLKTAWPEHWQTILTANNERPPLTLRVNARKASRDTYLARLATAGIAAYPAVFTTHGITLSTPLDVQQLPGFTEGYVSVQDAAAQLAAPLLDPQPRQRVLDACAAPGGKAAQLLEVCPALGELVAVENQPQRYKLLQQTLQRLELSATLILGDAGNPEAWWDGRLFDSILLDAPCSATGVIRRHPDIKWHKDNRDIAALATTQARLIKSLWPLLKPSGKLLYVTCSVLPAENQVLINNFIEHQHDAYRLPIDATWGHKTSVGLQILSGKDALDGFFYALLSKAD